jgi:hypothetical protein
VAPKIATLGQNGTAWRKFILLSYHPHWANTYTAVVVIFG